MKTFLDLAKERYSVRNYLDRPIVCLTLGHPGKEPDDRNHHLVRKGMGEVVHWGKF